MTPEPSAHHRRDDRAQLGVDRIGNRDLARDLREPGALAPRGELQQCQDQRHREQYDARGEGAQHRSLNRF